MSPPKKYYGILKEPLKLQTPIGLRRDRPDPRYLALGFPPEEWREHVEASEEHDWQIWLKKRHALFMFFDIDPNDPDAEIEAALALGYRHERNSLFANGRPSLGALGKLYGVANIRNLWSKLACRHVPGFKDSDENFRTRLTTQEWVKIFFNYYAVAAHLKETGEEVSVHGVTEILLDVSKLREVIPVAAAKSVQAILIRTGNTDRGAPRPLEARARFLRNAVREASDAVAALKAGRANEFQLQWVAEIYPSLHYLFRDTLGQNAPPESAE
ncbi:MAG: hypothetical protein AB7S74_01850 [Hyphomicrobium sp.]